VTNAEKNPVWLSVKIITALFQFPATISVFYKIFEDSARSPLVAGISTFFAILLIDVFLLAVLHYLESATLDPLQKIPLVVVGILLTIAVIWIGYLDEGILSWAPRLGFIGLVMTDVFNWVLELTRWSNSRERFEQRERDRMVKLRRKVMNDEFKRAIETENVRDVIRRIQTRRLGKDLNVEEMYGVSLDVLLDEPLTREDFRRVEPVIHSNGQWDIPDLYWEDYESNGHVPGEVYNVNGTSYFVSPYTEELFYKTAQGKPYSSSGAKKALGRHRSKFEGH